MQETFGFVDPPLIESAAAPVAPIVLGAGRVHIGTCGFSYRDWIGSVYPPGTKPADMLALYAGRFPAVEIDATYYGIPAAATFASMAARTPETFRFSVKLPGSLTHVPADAAVSDDAALFRERLQPLVASGKLAATLMQFPNGFHATPETRAYLRALAEALADLPLVAEFRNREWQSSETLALLAELGVAWCNVDEPHFESLLHPSSDVVGAVGYVRFHGRNARTWWTSSAVERYDYRYSIEELQPWAARVADMTEVARDTYVFFNNHRFGQAAVNANDFAGMLLGRSP